jgi:FeS assembly SUF system regulator
MFRLGKLTDYGTVVMTALAADPEHVHSAQELAATTRVSAPTVSKLLKRLSKNGLVEALRGAHGGYRLARAAEQINMADIVRALEGPIALTQCVEHKGQCSMESDCSTSANWQLINTAIREALEAVTLAQMTSRAQTHRAPANVQPLTFHPSARDTASRPR